MKILYSAGNRLGAGEQLQRFLKNIDKKHEVRISAYIKSSLSVPHIDWTLDALHYNILGTKKKSQLIKLFGGQNVKSLNLKNASIFVKEVGEFDPDLIISDVEPISAHIAKLYNKQLWYCSPLNILNGVVWDRYGFTDYQYKIEIAKGIVKSLPTGDRYYIYSFFGDISFRPFIKNGYQWVSPYYNKFENKFKIEDNSRANKIENIYNYLDDRKKNFFITDGGTDNISDAFYSGKKILVSPSLNNSENLINAIAIKKYNIGSDLGQIELMDKFSIEQFEKAFDKKYDENYLSVQNYPQLHERIEEYVRSL